MSGFSPDWLRLREPADHAGRNKALLSKVGRHFRAREQVHVLDLGCGTGSNLRGTFEALPDRQVWTLVDHDLRLLEAARRELADWADRTITAPDRFSLTKGSKRIDVRFRKVDLSHGMSELLAGTLDLVVAAALFDLVSRGWLERFAQALAAHRLPLYTVLTYDGRQSWLPPHVHDDSIHLAFLEHQSSDKGFGSAAGPQATAMLADALSAHGFQTETAESPWTLDGRSSALVTELATGIAHAAGQTGKLGPADVLAWQMERTEMAHVEAAHCRVGHLDLWAMPA